VKFQKVGILAAMAARYLIRFDDLCPTVDGARWAGNEALVRRLGIKPLVAVVPENRDPELVRGKADPGFWEHLRELQAEGWTLGLHGFQHLCEAHGWGLVPLHDRSEFAGLSEWEQHYKLERGLAILRGHGLAPTVWVAPRHGFDATTLRVLKSLGIEIVSDGLGLFPFQQDGMLWLPQQLWSGEERAQGLWTILIHTNTQTDAEFDRLAGFLEEHAADVITVEQAMCEFGGRGASVEDRVFRFAWLRRWDVRQVVARFR
jgi:predicted deacetylase